MPHASRSIFERHPPRLTLASQAVALPSEPSGFDFTFHIRLVCRDLILRLPELAHIDWPRVAVGFCQTRKAVAHGIQAALTPMRFEGGGRFTIRRGRKYGVQLLVDERGNEFLYLLTFYLPRFLNLSFKEKLITILHELWHIGPQFDGDLRRHEGRCYMHTSSEREYDAAMAVLAEKWLALDPPAEIYGFLSESFQSLSRRHGHVFGVRIPAPKLIPWA